MSVLLDRPSELAVRRRREVVMVAWPKTPPRLLPLLNLPALSESLPDGHRSRVTMPGYRKGMKPGNAGRRWPAEILTTSEMLRLLAATGKGYVGARDRALCGSPCERIRRIEPAFTSTQTCFCRAKNPCKSLLNNAAQNGPARLRIAGTRSDLTRRSDVPKRIHRGSTPIPWQERFWLYVTPGAPDECWEWQGSRRPSGYGQLGSGGGGSTPLVASRASYELHFGPIPDGLFVCHHCDNPPCCNPAHLFLGSASENARDMFRKGRSGPRFGSGRPNPQERLSDADVRSVREFYAAGASLQETFTHFGLNRGYTQRLVTGARRLSAGGPITRRGRALA